MEEFYKQIIKELEKALCMENYGNIIEKIFDERGMTLHSAIRQNTEFKKYEKEFFNVDKEIQQKFNNNREIIGMIEKYTGVMCASGYICEKLMYKHGVLDGMKLILDGTEYIDIKKVIDDDRNK